MGDVDLASPHLEKGFCAHKGCREGAAFLDFTAPRWWWWWWVGGGGRGKHSLSCSNQVEEQETGVLQIDLKELLIAQGVRAGSTVSWLVPKEILANHRKLGKVCSVRGPGLNMPLFHNASGSFPFLCWSCRWGKEPKPGLHISSSFQSQSHNSGHKPLLHLLHSWGCHQYTL